MMIKLSDLERKQFLIAAVQAESGTNNSTIINIPENPFVFLNNHGRQIVSDPEGDFAKKGYWRWAAGGMVWIIKQGKRRYIPLCLRDDKAPSYANHLVIGCGLSDSVQFWYDPTRIAFKEGLEEIACLVNGRRLMPIATSGYEDLFWEVHNFQTGVLTRLGVGVSSEDSVYAPLRIIETGKDTVLKVRGGDRVSEHYGIVYFDPQTRGIDLTKIVELKIPEGDVKDITLVDCEVATFGILNRDVILFDLDETTIVDGNKSSSKIKGAVARYKTGVQTACDVAEEFRITPNSLDAIEAIL